MDPELAALVPLLPDINLADDYEASRALLLQASARAATAPADDGIAVASRLIPGLPGGPEVTVRLYQPAGEAIRPALVYFHGGAFVLGPDCRPLTS